MATTDVIWLDPGKLSLQTLRRIADGTARLRLDPSCRPDVDASANAVAAICAGERAVYGINTGFGKLAQTRVPRDQLDQLQRNLVLSHAAGVGDPLPARTVRLTLALKLNALAQGYSGVRWSLLEALDSLLTHDILPVIPEKGSVGASGDLAPLAHLASVLIGSGEAWIDGARAPAAEGLARAGLGPLDLAPKEGLALLNGTQVSTALALDALFQAEEVFAAATVAGALSVDAALASAVPFDPRIHAVRGQPAQREIADVYAKLLQDSAILESHRNCDRVQDPYSLRCQPQVMGACLDAMRRCAATLSAEANGVSDNPLVFAPDTAVLSGGNFHAAPVALVADDLAVALAEVASISERRVAVLIDPSLSELPAFLVPEPGLNSGFMIAQVTAAALVSENKSLAHPASVDTIPTSANQEDHVSMSTYAARRTVTLAENARDVIAIELLAAAQGIDLRRPLQTSGTLEDMVAAVRAAVPFYDRDRPFTPDISAIAQLVAAGTFRGPSKGLLPSWGVDGQTGRAVHRD